MNDAANIALDAALISASPTNPSFIVYADGIAVRVATVEETAKWRAQHKCFDLCKAMKLNDTEWMKAHRGRGQVANY